MGTYTATAALVLIISQGRHIENFTVFDPDIKQKGWTTLPVSLYVLGDIYLIFQVTPMCGYLVIDQSLPLCVLRS